jgi:DNA-binding IclR family transcriptional regulator
LNQLPQQLRQLGDIRCDPSRLILAEQLGCPSIADHARRRLKNLTLMAIIAHAHARTHATSAMSKLEAKKKDHAAKVQQRNVRSFQPAPPGPVSARASAIGARRMAKDPKTRRQTLRRESISEPLRRKIKVDPPQLHIATLQQFW